jgi:hypothetical protein
MMGPINAGMRERSMRAAYRGELRDHNLIQKTGGITPEQLAGMAPALKPDGPVR